jgi:hypothetical protein
LIFKSTGKGKTAFIPFRIGSLYHHTRHYGHAALVTGALNNLLEHENEIKTNASPLIEIARQTSGTGQFEWFGLLNHSGQLGNAFHEPLPVQNIKLSFRSDKKIRSVKNLMNGNELPYQTQENGWVEIILPELQSFDIILVEYEY